jgi:DNA-binding MarR family transcriptional regulator
LTVKYLAGIVGRVSEPAWYDDVVIPALLRGARATYGRSIRTELAAAGLDDLPRNAAFVLGGMANRGGTIGELTRHLGVTRQAASQLVDTLVSRGYLSRTPDPDDRRRMRVELTERGRWAGRQVRAGVEAVDTELAGRLDPERLRALRAGLAVLIELGRPPTDPPPADPEPTASPTAAEPTAAEPPERPAGTDDPRAAFSHWAPIFPVRGLADGLAHYASLGFTVEPYDRGEDYGFAARDGLQLHLAHLPDLDPHTGAAAAYLYVSDADALAREWSRPGIGGRTIPPRDTPYGLREGAHLDPDNNLIRFGSTPL